MQLISKGQGDVSLQYVHGECFCDCKHFIHGLLSAGFHQL